MKKQKTLMNKMLSFLLMFVMVLTGISIPTNMQVNAASDDKFGTEYWGVKTEAKVYDDFTNDIWLQYQQKEMKVGETADLYPWRMEQIVTDTINNDVARPNFHFEIISGDSVELTPKMVTSSDDQVERADMATVTAKKPGTSVVKVTYDARKYKGKTWDAISDVNTAYAVYTVGEEGKATISSKELDNWRHYDTIYYNEGTTVPFKFTVKTENADFVQVTLNGKEIKGDKGTYTANLENRSNIIGIRATDQEGKVKSYYRVVDARFMEVNVANKTNAGEELRAGNTATISFRGITMPVYKLATIYNPQFPGGTWVNYNCPDLGDYQGKCYQWDLATNNSFDVIFKEEGNFKFSSKDGISCSWWGDQLGADTWKQGKGNPNTGAPTVKGNFSTLPSFTVSVKEALKGVDTQEVIDAINNLPAVKDLTLQNKKAVESARKAYDKLSEVEQAKVDNYNKLKDAEAKITELMKVPFLVSIAGEIQLMKEQEANDQGGHYYEVKVADGTKRVQLERYADMAVLTKDGEELAKEGTDTINIDPITLGKDNYIVLKDAEGNCNYLYFETGAITASVSPEVIYPGTEVTVTFKNLPIPSIGSSTALYTRYEININGKNEEVRSADGFKDPKKLSTITYTVPEGTKAGSYMLENGLIRRKYDFYNQGRPIDMTQDFYKGEMPEVKIEVRDKDQDMADSVMAMIQKLEVITSLDQEQSVLDARTAYDDLTEAQKKLVTNFAILKKAEASIAALKTPTEGGYVTVDIEKFTIGQGFYKEPVKVPFKAGQTVKDVLMALDGNNLVFNAKGTYLSGIRGADTGKVAVPAYIHDVLGGPTTEEAVAHGNRDNILSEFDYADSSGWMFTANGEMPGVGMADYHVKDKDVIRVQFTLMWGMDLGDSFTGTSPITVSNKDEAIRLLAEINSRKDKKELLAEEKIKAVYDKAAEIVQDAIAPQATVDQAANSLKNIVNQLPEEPEFSADEKAALDVADKINKIGDVALDSKEAIEEVRKAYDSLTDDQKAFIGKETLEILEKAEAQLKALEKEAEEQQKEEAANKAAADEVIKKIEAIGNVDASKESAINEARKAYNALTADQKKLVSDDIVKLLTQAETKLEELKKQEGNTGNDNNGNNNNPAKPVVHVTGVTLNKTSLSLLKGAKVQLQATVTPANASNKAVTYKSSNTSVASVDANGIVTAGKEGTATITVTTADGAKQAVCKVKVVEKLNVRATQNTKAIKLTWNKITGAKGYRIYRYDTKARKYKAIAEVKGNTYTVKRVNGKKGAKLASGTAYKFQVRSFITVKGKKVVKKAETFTTATKPSKVTLTKVSRASSTKAKLTWKKVKGASGYQIYMKTGKGSYKLMKTVKSAKTVKYTVSKLKKGKTYTFKVRAYKSVKTAKGGKLYGTASKGKKIK